MVSRRFRTSTLSALVVATVLLAGCSAAIGPLGDTAEDQIVQQVQQRVDDIDGFTATRTTTTMVDGETHTATAEVWVRPHTGEMRSEMLAPESAAGDVSVIGTNTSWFYDVSEDTVTRTNISDLRDDQRNLGTQLETLFDRHDVVDEGETQLDGQSVRKLRLVATNDTDGFGTGNVTMWVDPEKRFPLQIEYATGGEMNVTSTVRYENLTINPGIADSRFTFDPPADATVEESSVDVQTYDSRDALVDATDLSVPEPTVPDGFEFEQGVVFNGTVSLQYTNGSSSLLVSVTDGGDGPSSDRGETVTVGDHEGRLVSTGAFTSVRWSCDGVELAVSGDLGRDAILAVARSTSCP